MKTITPTHTFSYASTQNNVFHANIGEGLERHSHTYSHATICYSGSIVIRKEAREVVATKDSGAFNLVAGEWHEIEALEDATVFVNIFAVNNY